MGRVKMKRPALVVLALALLGLPSRAEAFCRTTTCRTTGCKVDDNGCPISGKPLFWASGCIAFSLQERGTQSLRLDDARLAIQGAFFAWTEVKCADGRASSLAFSESPDVSCRKSEFNKGAGNVNVVLFQDDDWKYRGIDGTLAKTTVTFDANSGEILDADIEINSAFNEMTVKDVGIVYDLQSVLTHEVGHFIGIAHSPIPNSLMFPAYEAGTLRRALDADDVEAVCSIYPPGRKAVCDTTPRGGFSGSCDDPPASGCTFAQTSETPQMSFWLGALGLVALRRRRSFRR